MHTGHETAFSTYYEYTRKRIAVSPVTEGGTDRVDSQCNNWQQENLLDWPFLQGYLHIDVHFHPNYDVTPSPQDLAKALYDGALENPPIIGIGSIDDNARGILLLMRRAYLLKMPSRQMGDEILTRAKQQPPPQDPKDYARSLDLPGYFGAVCLGFRLTQRQALIDKDALSHLAFGA